MCCLLCSASSRFLGVPLNVQLFAYKVFLPSFLVVDPGLLEGALSQGSAVDTGVDREMRTPVGGRSRVVF